MPLRIDKLEEHADTVEGTEGRFPVARQTGETMTINFEHFDKAENAIVAARSEHAASPNSALVQHLLVTAINELRTHRKQMKPLDFDDYQIYMIPQGFEVHRQDFGDALVDRIAFEICSAMNVGCGSKRALMDLLYSSATSILEHTNRAGVTWTPIGSVRPDEMMNEYVLYRWHESPRLHWRVGYGYWRGSEIPDEGQWMFSSGHTDWPDGAEWMAIPI